MDVESGLAAVNGARLYYEVAGSGPAVALVHGFTLDTRMWDDQFRPLAERYRVVRYDQRGFGRSDPPPGEPFAPHDDLRALLDFLAIDAVAAVGLSAGGAVATNFALAYPERTRALVLIDAAIDGHAWSAAWRERMGHVGRGAREAGVEVGRERWLAHELFAPALERPEVARRLAAMVGDYSGWHWRNRGRDIPLDPSAIGRLGEIAAPVLAIAGARDLPDFHAQLARVREQLPAARVATIPGAGHMANMEAPDEVNRLIAAFLADVL